jgi:hypothetical protein
MATNHDKTAERLAWKDGVEYNRGQGPDVVSSRRAIEVETVHTVRDGLRQLQGFKKPVYIAGADAAATKAALEAAEATTVGVMNSQGKVVKRSTRTRQ